jgi:hypothetical protein
MNHELRGGNALWGIVAMNGGLFTVCYRTHGSSCGIQRQGYDRSVFDGLPGDLPILRFDLVGKDYQYQPCPLENVEHHYIFVDSMATDTAGYLKWYQDHGVPLFLLKDMP